MDENGVFAGKLAELVEQSTRPWSEVNKSKLPAACFLWVEDPEKKATWHLPYREGAGGIDDKTGLYRQAGEVNIAALRAVAAAIGGARSGKAMSMPSKIRRKIDGLLKRYKIGEYAESANPGDEEREEGVAFAEITEAAGVAQFAGVSLDKQAHVVKGVAVLRPESVNVSESGRGRYYGHQALQDATVLSEGTKVYIDHEVRGSETRGGVRSTRDLLGYLQDSRLDENKVVRSNLHYLASHAPWFEPIVEQMADKVGLSVHAFGSVVADPERGMDQVERLTRLKSADLVTETGSTRSLFESRSDAGTETQEEEAGMDLTKLTLAELREARPDIVEAVEADSRAVVEAQKTDKEQKDRIAMLESENKTLKTKVDEAELKEKIAARKAKITAAIKESGIKEEMITATFREVLEAADTDEKVKALLTDRKALIEGANAGVRDMGDEQKLDESAGGKKDNGATDDQYHAAVVESARGA
ncbi:MAG: hypothetical protein WC683_03950 [bacterium]